MPLSIFRFSTPLVTSDVATTIAFLNNIPALRQEIADRLAANVLTSQIFPTKVESSTGLIVVQKDQAQTAQTSAEDGTEAVASPIAEGTAYQRVYTGLTTPVKETTVKIGLFDIISREQVMRESFPAVDTMLRQLVNSYIDSADGLSTTAVVADVDPSTGPHVTGTALSTATTYAQVAGSIGSAQTVLFNQRRGYRGDKLFISASNATLLAYNSALATIFALNQDKDASVYTGTIGRLGNVEIVQIPDALCTGTPFATGALLIDSGVFGLLLEQVALNSNAVYLDQSRSEAPDSWHVSINHNFTPVVKTPKAACWIEGLSS